jgi:hypothetical protein
MYTLTQTHIYIPIFLVLFSKKAKVQIDLGPGVQGYGYFFITDIV